VEEIAPSDEVAARQANALTSLLILANNFAAPLADNAANIGFKELLKTAEVAQKRNRVVVTATLSPSLVSGLASDENSAAKSATESAQGASK
jgi:hypothetical protein